MFPRRFALIAVAIVSVHAQHGPVGCASAEINVIIAPELLAAGSLFARPGSSAEERLERLTRLSAAYAVKPGESRAAKLGAFVRQLEEQGLELPLDLLDAQIKGEQIGYPVPLPAAWSATGHAVAPVPFAFQRLSDAAAFSSALISDPEIHAADATTSTVTHDLVEHVRHAILNARSGLSRLVATPAVLTLEGMSDKWIRHFLNNLASAPGTRYLEVGSWRGSTFTSALAGNEPTIDLAVAVDVWDEDRTELEGSEGILGTVLGPGSYSKAVCEKTVRSYTREGFFGERAFMAQGDFRDFALEPLVGVLAEFNVYLYDGPHAEQDHFDGLAMMLPKLARVFVFLVDDFNGVDEQRGTLAALEALGLKVHFAEVLGGGRPGGLYGAWYNGFFAAVLEQKAAQ